MSRRGLQDARPLAPTPRASGQQGRAGGSCTPHREPGLPAAATQGRRGWKVPGLTRTPGTWARARHCSDEHTPSAGGTACPGESADCRLRGGCGGTGTAGPTGEHIRVGTEELEGPCAASAVDEGKKKRFFQVAPFKLVWRSSQGLVSLQGGTETQHYRAQLRGQDSKARSLPAGRLRSTSQRVAPGPAPSGPRHTRPACRPHAPDPAPVRHVLWARPRSAGQPAVLCQPVSAGGGGAS